MDSKWQLSWLLRKNRKRSQKYLPVQVVAAVSEALKQREVIPNEVPFFGM